MSEASCSGCGREATLACPSCVKLKKETGVGAIDYYCSQDCFKSNWASHKKKHKVWIKMASSTKSNNAVQGMPPEFENYSDWTGSLRPFPRSMTPQERQPSIPGSIPRPDYWEDGIPTSERENKKNGIRVYSSKDIAGIRRACEVGREVLDACGRAVRAGVTTAEIDDVCFRASIERGAYPSPLNYYNFPCSVCTSVNEVICHGIPDSRELKDGDIVNVDVSVFVDGYHGDLNETFLVGNVDNDGIRVTETAFKCLQAAADLIKPGAYYRDIGAVVDKVARGKNCSVVRTYCGHGIGDLFHTTPTVPHYAKNKATGIMKPGHVFTIEPMINLGVWRDRTWPDDWTSVTADGKRSAQFEHTFLVTQDGYEILTKRIDEPRMEWSLDKVQR